ncbi:MAG TPA: methyltransferase domain-containing protein [Desulfomonilaceae bacterium]|nr:methyltransferase domain-containing protein [Desulfomonilaceae bacterium]
MTVSRKQYPDDHWIKLNDPEKALAAYMDQQNKAYSRVKNAFVRELLGNLAGKRFLDYGCGCGMFIVHAARQGASEVVGVDAEHTALATARYFAAEQGVEHRCTFVRSEDFLQLPTGSHFDVVLMKDVIEHVPDDVALLHRAASALVPGGVLVLSTQNLLSLNYLLEGSFQRFFRRNKDWCGWDETHLRFYTSMSLDKKLKEAGFTSTDWRSAYLVPYTLPAMGPSGKFVRLNPLSRLDTMLGDFFPFNRLGWNIIVRARTSPLVPEKTAFQYSAVSAV